MPKPKLPPGPGNKHRIRHIFEFTANRAEFLHRMRKHYGDLVYFRIGPAKVYLINEPELVKEILQKHKQFPKTNSTEFLKPVLGEGLVTATGEWHRRQRALIQPAFQPKRVREHAGMIVRIADKMANEWQDGAEINLSEAMARLALNAITGAMFSTQNDDLQERVEAALDVILPTVDKMARPGGTLMMKLPTVANRRYYKAREDLNKITYEFIAEAHQRNEDRGDLLSMLLAAREGDTGMTDGALRDEVLTIFLAGHETTGLTLAWCWYLLAQNPDVFAKLRAELDQVLGGRLPEVEDMQNMPYLKHIMDETLRLYPASYLTDRTPAEDWDTGEYIIPKGVYVMVSPYTMGRHEKYYPDPDRFDPDRFLPEAVEKRPKWAYFPFGGGERRCIGEHFAWLELNLMMATLAQRWSMTLAPGQTIGTNPLITLRPDAPIHAKLKARVHSMDPVSA